MARILVVDDDPAILNLVSVKLGKAGHEVETARDAREGLVKASHRFDLVVTDVLMPVIDGWDFVRVLRSWPETALIPVVFLTALGDEEDRIKGFRLGADDYVAKPFNPDELVLRVERILERSESLSSSVRERFHGAGPSIKGSLRQTGVSTVLHLLDMERSTGELVFSRAGRTARLRLRTGRVVRARFDGDEDLRGFECIFALLGWPDGDFAFFPGEVEPGEDEIGRPTTAVLMDAARRLDESGR